VRGGTLPGGRFGILAMSLAVSPGATAKKTSHWAGDDSGFTLAQRFPRRVGDDRRPARVTSAGK
jgi:hypothetical protein